MSSWLNWPTWALLSREALSLGLAGPTGYLLAASFRALPAVNFTVLAAAI